MESPCRLQESTSWEERPWAVLGKWLGGWEKDSRKSCDSAFHVGELGGDLSFAYGEDVHATQMPGLSVADLAIHPADGGAVTADDDFLGLESRIGIAEEPLAPEDHHHGLALDPAAVRGGRRVLEDGVFGQQKGRPARIAG